MKMFLKLLKYQLQHNIRIINNNPMILCERGMKANACQNMNKKTRQGRKVAGGNFRLGGKSQIFSYMFISIEDKFRDNFTNNKVQFVTKYKTI